MIVLIVPSRGRPELMAAMAESVHETSPSTVVVAVLDNDDPTRDRYRGWFLTHAIDRVGYTASLNEVARLFWGIDGLVLGAFGDDVRFRSPGWDRVVESTLTTPGIAYGDDLIHGKNHPTAVFMSSAIARALGWLALPATTHQWADDGWKKLGQETGLLRFMPEVVVEHLHPAVGKGDWDDTYRDVFEDERAKRDYEGFTGWLETGLAADVAKVRAVA